MSEAVARPEIALVEKRFGKGLLKSKTELQNTFLCVETEIVPAVIEFLKTECGYDYFSECLGVDYSTWTGSRDLPNRFEVVYNLMSTTTYERIFVKAGVDDGQTVPTCKHIFLGAEYPEREINDMFGVVFDGNEQTTRFLLPDDWVGFPLRKEFPLGGEEVLFDQGDRGPAVADLSMPHAGESFEGKTGSEDVGGR